MVIWDHNNIYLANYGADYLCITSTKLSLVLQMQHMYCWGGSVSDFFSGWMVKNDHPNCAFGTKNLNKECRKLFSNN